MKQRTGAVKGRRVSEVEASVNVRQELDLRSQVLLQPWHYLKQVNMEVSRVGRRVLAAVPSALQARVGWVAHVGDAPAQNSHLGGKSSVLRCSSSPFKTRNRRERLTWK